MATVAHHVYSNYDPDDRERLEADTGQLDAEADAVDPWLTEKPFGGNKRIADPPRFVAATVDYNQWTSGNGTASSSRTAQPAEEAEVQDSLGGWYRSLARKTPIGTPRASTPTPPPLQQEILTSRKRIPKRDKNNWFIVRALETSGSAEMEGSQPPTSSNSPAPPTLADILARDPPPLPTQEPYIPPVWLAIGPDNKGFAMLQKGGWEEGEALGRAARRPGGLGYTGKGKEIAHDERAGPIEDVRKEVIDLTCLEGDMVDLTILDDEADSEPDGVFAAPKHPKRQKRSPVSSVSPGDAVNDLDHAPRALLTPLPTVLKADRLGIGLKAKTSGSGLYREPVKRVTHSQAALAAHVRANEALQRTKKAVGRGRRGFERMQKKEEEGRKNMLAYLNVD